jgi:predicted GIY-YIG superfamily endonuclease
MRYVYILQGAEAADRHYTGSTKDLKARVAKHNGGDVPHTAKFRPWRLKTYLAFSDEQRAIEFERYLKTASGRAFAKKRLSLRGLRLGNLITTSPRSSPGRRAASRA